MGINSSAKGKSGEREAVKFLKSIGFPDAQRTQQYNGLGLSDVLCPESLPDLHIEVKYGYPYSSFNLGNARWYSAIEQAGRDSDGNPWVILWRPKGASIWRMTYRSTRGEGLVTVVGTALIQAMNRMRPKGDRS